MSTFNLTPREVKILRELVKDGARDAVIAKRLGISSGTVKVYFTKMRIRLGMQWETRTALALWALDLGRPDITREGYKTKERE